MLLCYVWHSPVSMLSSYPLPQRSKAVLLSACKLLAWSSFPSLQVSHLFRFWLNLLDLIRHPEGLERTGFRLSPEWRFLLKMAIYKQTLTNLINSHRHSGTKDFFLSCCFYIFVPKYNITNTNKWIYIWAFCDVRKLSTHVDFPKGWKIFISSRISI